MEGPKSRARSEWGDAPECRGVGIIALPIMESGSYASNVKKSTLKSRIFCKLNLLIVKLSHLQCQDRRFSIRKLLLSLGDMVQTYRAQYRGVYDSALYKCTFTYLLTYLLTYRYCKCYQQIYSIVLLFSLFWCSYSKIQAVQLAVHAFALLVLCHNVAPPLRKMGIQGHSRSSISVSLKSQYGTTQHNIIKLWPQM